MIHTDPKHVYNTVQIKKDFEYVDRIAKLMDDKYEVLGFRFGLDPILNLIPYAGSIIGFFVSAGLVVIMAKNTVSQKVVVKMVLNVILDAIIGSLPLIGNIGDFFFKANKKNVELLKGHYFEGKNHGSGMGIIITIIIVFLLLAIILCYILVKLVVWTFEFLGELF